MKNLESIFKPIFNSHGLSDGRIVKYGEVNLARIRNNNPDNRFTILIEPSDKALNDFKISLAGKSIEVSRREGTTINLDNEIALFKEKALQREGLIRDLFGVGTAAYIEFYPQGTHEYTMMNKTNADILMKRMAEAYKRNSASIPENRQTEFSDIYTAYTEAHNAHITKSADANGKQGEKDAARENLEYQLQYNLLTIAREYIGKPEMYSKYFEAGLLTPYHSKKRAGNGNADNGDASYKLSIPSLSTKQAEFTITDDETLNLNNTGSVPLSVYIASGTEAGLPTNAFILMPGVNIEKAVSELGPAGSSLLFIHNGASTAGSLEIDIV